MIAARKKLGDDIVENYAVYNHDAFQNCVWVGRTATGVELWFNREYMACDLKIGIGCITAHVHVGFGGGAKLIMPGVAGIETVNQFHNQLYRDPGRAGLGNFENNIMRAECDAAGDITGLNFKVDCLINRRGEIADLYAGSFKATHSAGGEAAKEHYGIPYATGYDIAVCNAYGKVNESAIALILSLTVLKGGASGTAVLICDAPEGQIPHYVMRAWGSNYGGRHFNPRPKGFLPLLLKKLIAVNPHPDRTFLDLVCDVDDAVIVKTWEEALAILEEDYPAGARIAVIQDGTMQYIKKPDAGC
jgi:nickel-dependent lactate racemase